MSLRARLLTVLLVVTAGGLLLLGGITYAEQRSFLSQRVDQQTREATGAVGKSLEDSGTVDGTTGQRAGGGGPRVDLPPGTYGELRDASGKVLGSVALGYATTTTTAPDLPATPATGRLTTIDAGDDGRYRVLATAGPDGRVTVVAVPLREVDQTLHRLLLVEALVIAAVLALLGGIAWAVVRVGLLPLERMAHTAGAIAAGDLSRRVSATDPRTESGRLGLALNAMLDRLERAFAEREAGEERLRQFLADASHELRTPLTSIRGYAELFRLGAGRDPASAERAMGRIEDEATRMGVLVEDLLALARLDQIAEAPHGDVDLAAIVRDAADDARATAPGRPITDVADAPVLVHGDAHQLRQVLANLVRNALVHTPEGTVLDLAVREVPDGIVLEVRDHGPGLPTGDPAQLFERFWRSEGGRERGRAGAGLGLAIVAAIVDAHGGEVRATDAEGGGAVFTVVLPRPVPGRARVPAYDDDVPVLVGGPAA